MPDNATGVAVGANIILTFNENVAAGSGNITLKKSSDNSTVQAMAVGGANVSYLAQLSQIRPQTWPLPRLLSADCSLSYR